MSTGPQMMSIGIVLLVIFYVFAVMFTQLFGSCYDDGCYASEDWITDEFGETISGDKGINYFGRMDYTLFTLFMLMTLDDWSNIIRQTQTEFVWAVWPILAFILISSFVMLNLVIAVLCEALSALQDEEEESSGEDRGQAQKHAMYVTAYKNNFHDFETKSTFSADDELLNDLVLKNDIDRLTAEVARLNQVVQALVELQVNYDSIESKMNP